jgi:RNA polymerase sigma-70 factor (ECF subfamily)
MEAFIELLREDAALRMPPGRAIVGAPAIGRFWFSPRGTSSCAAAQSRLVPTRANGRPAVAIYKRGDDGRLGRFAVMLLDVDGDKIAGFDAYLDPELVRLFEDDGS